MCSGCRDKAGILKVDGGALQVLLAAALLLATTLATISRELRVCADPNNLPFSNARMEGFENKIVDIVAKELVADVSYVWWAQRRGFVRNTLNAGLCDVIPGIPAAVNLVRTTVPYYRSSYVFISRQEGPNVTSFDDPRLADLKVGVQVIGDDGANSPPVAALARRGIVGRLRAFPVYGDYSRPHPTSQIVEAVANGDVDVAVAWGPLAGYFAARQPVALRVAPVSPLVDLPILPMIFDISMGVRRGDKLLQRALDEALAKHQSDIDAVLMQYDVPRVDGRSASTR